LAGGHGVSTSAKRGTESKMPGVGLLVSPITSKLNRRGDPVLSKAQASGAIELRQCLNSETGKEKSCPVPMDIGRTSNGNLTKC
jgi:hypothetical protein